MESFNRINPYINQPLGYQNPNNRRVVRAQSVPQNNEMYDVKNVAGAGLLQLVALGLQKASDWCGKKLMQGKEFTSAPNVKNIADKMLSDNKLTGNVAVEYIDNANKARIAKKYSKPGLDILNELEPVARGANAFYSDQLKLAVAPKTKPSLLLHELGHAVNANKGRFLKFLQKSRMYAASVPTALVFINNATQKPDGEKSFVEKHAIKIGFLAFLPTIIEEGLASLRGINAAKQVKKTVNSALDLKPLKRNYAFAWLTYVLAGAGLGVAAKLSILENKR